MAKTILLYLETTAAWMKSNNFQQVHNRSDWRSWLIILFIKPNFKWGTTEVWGYANLLKIPLHVNQLFSTFSLSPIPYPKIKKCS